ncbi:MFS transporter [Paenarthrobacter sp. NPDC089714]|uniref:MFS transporter n=1 Tax=Paenarthrobacter sp. NPDC089714 TaxID=3364377 RepID=UPI00382E2AFA
MSEKVSAAMSVRKEPRRRLGVVAGIGCLVLLAGSYVINSMDRSVYPVVMPEIRQDFGFSLNEGGLLATIFTLGLGLAALPTGFMIDKFSRKAAMLVGIALYSAFTVLTAVSTGFGDMLAYRALSGVGESMQMTAVFTAVGAYFVANRAFALGSLNFAFGIGTYLGPVLGANIMSASGQWQVPFYVYGGIGFLFVALLWLFLPKTFSEYKEQAGEDDGVTAADRFSHVPAKLLNRNVLLLGATAAVMGVTMFGYIALYPTYLRTELGFSLQDASMAAGMYGIGALLGLPAGWLSDRFSQRPTLLICLLSATVVGFLLFNGPTSVLVQCILSVLLGALFNGFCHVNIYSAIQRSVRPDMLGRASGVFVAAFYCAGVFAGTLFATLVQSLGWSAGSMIQMSFVPLIGAVTVFFLKVDRLAPAGAKAKTLH